MFATTTQFPADVIGHVPDPSEVFSGWDSWGPHVCRQEVVPAWALRDGDVVELDAARGVDFWVASLFRARGRIFATLHDGCGRNRWEFHPDQLVLRNWTWVLP